MEIPTDDLIARYDVPAPRYTSYPPVPAWTSAFSEAQWREALAALGHAPQAALGHAPQAALGHAPQAALGHAPQAALGHAPQAALGHAPQAPVSLYVHVPFCRQVCTFCGCNVVGGRSAGQADEYLSYLEREIELLTAAIGTPQTVARLHVGGGTPTYLDDAQLQRLCAALTRAFTIAPGAEMAVEIDPRVTRPAQLELLRRLGFSRVSIGVQDVDAEVQAAIGRGQSEAQTRAAFATCRALGFTSVSLDLVYGLPKQTPATWARTLDVVTELRPDRLSLFSFAYVPAARPKHKKLPIADMPVGPPKLRLFLQAAERLTAAGYVAVGMDHFALPHDELAQAARAGMLHRDFQGYTMPHAGPLLGLGPSAISDLGGCYAQNASTLGAYYGALDESRLPTARGHVLDADDVRRRAIIRDLLCRFAADLGELTVCGLQAFANDGLATLAQGRLTVTPLGRSFVRTIAKALDTRSAGGPASQAV